MYTIRLLLAEISVHTGNTCSDIQGAWTSLRSVNTPWMSEEIFSVVWKSSSVDKSSNIVVIRKCMMVKKISRDDFKIWTMVIFGLSSIKYKVSVTYTQSLAFVEKKNEW